MHVHLGRRQANAFGFVHGLEHVGNQGFDARVNACHRLGNLVQPRVGELEDGEQSHENSSKMSLFSLLLAWRAASGCQKRCSIKGLSAKSPVIYQDIRG
jgi:hypothetical protein